MPSSLFRCLKKEQNACHIDICLILTTFRLGLHGIGTSWPQKEESAVPVRGIQELKVPLPTKTERYSIGIPIANINSGHMIIDHHEYIVAASLITIRIYHY